MPCYKSNIITNVIPASNIYEKRQQQLKKATKYISNFRFNVQSQVEKPFMHMIGRSKSTIVDQLAYVPERIAEIQNSTVPLQYAGRTYKDIVRFYSGKLTKF